MMKTIDQILNENEQQEITRLINDGFTNGILDNNEESYRLVWNLETNKFEY